MFISNCIFYRINRGVNTYVINDDVTLIFYQYYNHDCGSNMRESSDL